MKYQRESIVVAWVGLVMFIAIVIGAFLLPGCAANAPHSFAQLEDMDEMQFKAYLDDTVHAWSLAAGQVIAVEAADDIDSTLRFCADLDAAAEGVITPHAIGEVADAVHFKSKHTASLLIVGQLILSQRGGLPTGEHGKALLHAVAAGIREGLGTVPEK